MAEGRTIASVSSVVCVARDSVSALLVEESRTVDASGIVQLEWSGGVGDVSYLTTVKVTDSAGEVHEQDGEILVADVQFTVPVGLTSTYLSADEYVARFGTEETVRLTDQDRKNVVDRARLEAALKDATDTVESYLGVRYALPLSPVPQVVKGLVAALAREKLFSQRPTPQVTAEADRARSQLRDLSAGRMVLADVTGETLEGGTIVDSNWGGVRDANVFNAEKLCGYGQGL
jgi:phage gp36-like protein